MDGDRTAADGYRRYSSFLIRRWELPGRRQRLEVSHVQSGEQAMLAGLDEAMRWIEGFGGGAVGGEMSATPPAAAGRPHPSSEGGRS